MGKEKNKKDPGETLFQIRLKGKKEAQQFSFGEIVSLIEKGKISGSEKIAAPPYETWGKIASHPEFYDVFVAQLYRGKYTADGKVPSDEPASIVSENKNQDAEKKLEERAENATRQGAPPPLEEPAQKTSALAENELGETRQIAPAKSSYSEVNLDPAVIEELFSDVAPQPVPQMNKSVSFSLNLKKENQSPSAKPPESMVAPLDFAGKVTEEESPEVIRRKKARDRRRKLLWGTVLALLLVLLYEAGKEEPKKNELTSGPTATSTSDEVARGIDPSANEVSWITEAERISKLDTPPSYKFAAELLQRSLNGEQKDKAFGHYLEALARFYPNSPNPEIVRTEIKDQIAKGRMSDPQGGQFFRVEALMALYEGRTDEAKKLILNAVETDPLNVSNALVLGEISYSVQDMQSAKSALMEALKADPQNVRAYYYLGLVAFSLGDDRGAANSVQEALKLNPVHAPSFQLLADIASRLSRLQEAKTFYLKAGEYAEFGPRGVASRVFERLGQLESVSNNKLFANHYYRLALDFSSNPSQSLKDTVASLSKEGTDIKALRNQYVRGKDFFLERAEVYWQQKDLEKAYEQYQAALFLDPNDAVLCYRVGEILEKKSIYYEDFRRAMAYYGRSIELNPKFAPAYVALGLMESEQYNLSRGYQLLSQAALLAPESAEAYRALAKHYYMRQDFREAREQLKVAQKLDPNHSETLYYAGLLILKAKANREAMDFFSRAFSADPDNYPALVEWLKIKVNLFEKNFAIKFVNELMEKDPRNANLFWALGEIYLANKEPRRAIDFFHKALDVDNKHAKVRMALGEALEASGEIDKAVAEYRLASLLDRKNPEGFFRGGVLLFQTRKYSQSKEAFEFLVKVSPNYPGAHRYLSQIYRLAKDEERAIAELKIEIQNNPRNAKNRIELAQLYLDYKKEEDAIAELQEVTNLPSLAEAPEHVFDKIRAYLLLSQAYRSQERNESAERAIQLALEIDPNAGELHRELGYVYMGLHRDTAAVSAFKEYLNRVPAARDADRIKQIIKKLEVPQ